MKQPCPWCGQTGRMRYRAAQGRSEILKLREIDDHDCPRWRIEPDRYDQSENDAQVARGMAGCERVTVCSNPTRHEGTFHEAR